VNLKECLTSMAIFVVAIPVGVVVATLIVKAHRDCVT